MTGPLGLSTVSGHRARCDTNICPVNAPASHARTGVELTHPPTAGHEVAWANMKSISWRHGGSGIVPVPIPIPVAAAHAVPVCRPLGRPILATAVGRLGTRKYVVVGCETG